MGIADAIVDLVSSGTTLRENNLKEIEGGVIVQSQVITPSSCDVSASLTFFWYAIWVAFLTILWSYFALSGSPCRWQKVPNAAKRCTWYNTWNARKTGGTSEGCRSIYGVCNFFHAEIFVIPVLVVWHISRQVTANMRGSSAEEVAERILSQTSLSGLQVTQVPDLHRKISSLNKKSKSFT